MLRLQHRYFPVHNPYQETFTHSNNTKFEKEKNTKICNDQLVDSLVIHLLNLPKHSKWIQIHNLLTYLAFNSSKIE